MSGKKLMTLAVLALMASAVLALISTYVVDDLQYREFIDKVGGIFWLEAVTFGICWLVAKTVGYHIERALNGPKGKRVFYAAVVLLVILMAATVTLVPSSWLLPMLLVSLFTTVEILGFVARDRFIARKARARAQLAKEISDSIECGADDGIRGLPNE